MKSLIKNSAKIFLTIIIFCNLLFVFGVNFSYAAEKKLKEKCVPGSDTCKEGQCLQTGYSTYQCILFAPQVSIPDTPYVQPQNSTAALGNYIKGLYNYFIGITAIVATIVLMIGGFQWVVAGGNSSKIEEAKGWIMGALSGLALALSSYMILSLITPNLVNFQVHNIAAIGTVGCCEKSGTNLGTISLSLCTNKGGTWKGESSSWDNAQKKCLSSEEVMAAYLKNDACKGYPIASTKGGSDPDIANTQCPIKCKPLTADFTKSFWYGSHNEIYCCTCINTSNPDYCNGKPENLLCNDGAGLCKSGHCVEP